MVRRDVAADPLSVGCGIHGDQDEHDRGAEDAIGAEVAFIAHHADAFVDVCVRPVGEATRRSAIAISAATASVAIIAPNGLMAVAWPPSEPFHGRRHRKLDMRTLMMQKG